MESEIFATEPYQDFLFALNSPVTRERYSTRLRSFFVLANGALSSNTSNEGPIRRTIIEDDLVDCVIALPGQLFYSTTIPASLWFLSRNKKKQEPRDRRHETLFIDARRMGVLIDRVHRELTDQEITLISKTYHTWRDDNGADTYQDISGFCRSVKSSEIAEHGYILTPGRYVGATGVEKDSEDFGVKMKHLVRELEQQFVESSKLEREIREGLHVN